MNESEPALFESSRRLTGPNLYFNDCGAVLEVFENSPDIGERWAVRVRVMMAALGWPEREFAVHRHRSGASLAFAAPEDQLLTATEINEWAWQSIAANAADFPPPQAPGHPASWDDDAAERTLRLMARGEANPAAVALMQSAATQHLPFFFDDEGLTIGAGEGSLTWANDALPADVPWRDLHDIPTVLVTGSNGKTTTVRLLSAMFEKAGRRSGFNCTDGVFVGNECVASGDYSGPNGARRVLRDRRVQTAVLETARGGILRRGLAVHRADAAIVTNISPDHFGEYGVHDLSDLADAKLVLARAIGDDGVLVLNADDPLLLAKSSALSCPLAWFSLDDAHPRLLAHRREGGATCGVADGVMWLDLHGERHRLGDVDAMPLTMAGSARYNIANIAGAALVAACMDIATQTIAEVLADFGASRQDNPGRLERWQINGASVLLDYAHNPEGLSGLLGVARSVVAKTQGRLGLLLGQAGNRDDDAIRELARTAAAARPDFVVLKDLDGYMRGRGIGEVPQILRDALLVNGMADSNLRTILPEVEAAQAMLAWAQPGDVVVLPVHNLAARAVVVAWLDGQRAAS